MKGCSYSPRAHTGRFVENRLSLGTLCLCACVCVTPDLQCRESNAEVFSALLSTGLLWQLKHQLIALFSHCKHILPTHTYTRTHTSLGLRKRHIKKLTYSRETAMPRTIWKFKVNFMLSPIHLSVVCLLSVTFVCPTQAVQIFGNISTALGTLSMSMSIVDLYSA